MTGMLTVSIGAVLNLILDPLFIFVLHMGVRGAALATIISQGISAIWVLHFLTGKKAILTLSLAYMKLDFRLVKESVLLDLPDLLWRLQMDRYRLSVTQLFPDTVVTCMLES